MAFKRSFYRCLNAAYRRDVPHSSKGVPLVPFGTWLYRTGLLLLAVAPEYGLDQTLSEQEIRNLAALLRMQSSLVEEPNV